MAKLTFGLQQSLDGYVDHQKLGRPGLALSSHFMEHLTGLSGLIYGRRTYQIMRYWDDDQPGWDAQARAFALTWRSKKKWVVSHSLQSVGPNATLIEREYEALIGGLKQQSDGEIGVAGPHLAASLTALGLIDEYRLYLRPIVLGGGTAFFADRVPLLRLVASDVIGEDTVRLTYAPL